MYSWSVVFVFVFVIAFRNLLHLPFFQNQNHTLKTLDGLMYCPKESTHYCFFKTTPAPTHRPGLFYEKFSAQKTEIKENKKASFFSAVIFEEGEGRMEGGFFGEYNVWGGGWEDGKIHNYRFFPPPQIGGNLQHKQKK